MNENFNNIVEEYFEAQKECFALSCQKVIFEPSTKREYFFEEEKWCYFEFLCDDKDYRLISLEGEDFSQNCVIKEMSYEIRMLLSYIRLRNVKTVDKAAFSNYVTNYEKEKVTEPDLSLEKYNFDIRMREDAEFKRSDKIVNRILAGCLTMIAAMLVLFAIFLFSAFFAPKANAISKYSPDFIKNFIMCKKFSESKYNVAYNSQSTYEIKGFDPQGSGKCIYVETNTWLRGSNVTTCYFDEKQLEEYYNAMINPDIKGSVLVKGMPVVGNNEEVVFLKYFNNPEICQTKAVS